MSKKNTKAQVKDRAKELVDQGGDDAIVTLSTGVRVRLHAVSSVLVEDLKSAIPYPDVPMVWIEAKEREEENPNDPHYLSQVEQVNIQRGNATLDALILFGVELLDGMPEDDDWLDKLRMLQRIRQLELDGFDLEDEFDREYLYKRYVAVAGADIQTLGPLHGLRPQEVAAARNTFLGDQARLRRERLPIEERGEDGARPEPADDGVGGSTRSES